MNENSEGKRLEQLVDPVESRLSLNGRRRCLPEPSGNLPLYIQSPSSHSSSAKIQTDDRTVKAILVNIFGGIVRCDLIAEGIIAAVKDVGVDVPVVVRLEGTNVEKGRELLKKSGLDIIPAEDLTDAAKKVVGAAA